jgi:hypothetical protein
VLTNVKSSGPYSNTELLLRPLPPAVNYSLHSTTIQNFQQRPMSRPLSNHAPPLFSSKRVYGPMTPRPFHPRLFSSTTFCRGPALLLPPLVTLLKSTYALKYVNLLSRLSLSLVPVFLKRFFLSATVSQSLGRMVWFALLFPALLLAAIAIASMERTPISGRWRVLMLSTEEEDALVTSLVGSSVSNASDHWLEVLRHILGETDAPVGTLLGGRVLDAAIDWRVGWAQITLAALEASLGKLVLTDADVSLDGLRPPPLVHSFVPRCTEQRASSSALSATRYPLLVVDRPEKNAFSFGFAPQTGSTVTSDPGVVVVCA